MKKKSCHAVLDVRHGRRALAKRLAQGEREVK